LLLPQMLEHLPSALLRRDRVCALLEEERPGVSEEGLCGRVERVEVFAEAQRVEFITFGPRQKRGTHTRRDISREKPVLVLDG